MEFSLQLPAEPNKVENFILNICGHHGFTNCQVVAENGMLIIRYDSTVTPSSEGLGRVRC